MADEVVVVKDDATDGNSDFAAGVAAATAQQAEQKSTEAAYVAENAESTASAAADIAVTADNKASEAQYGVVELGERLGALEGNVQAGFASLAETLNNLTPPKPPVDEGNKAPAPVPKEERQSAQKDETGNSDKTNKSDKKDKPRGFGAWKK